MGEVLVIRLEQLANGEGKQNYLEYSKAFLRTILGPCQGLHYNKMANSLDKLGTELTPCPPGGWFLIPRISRSTLSKTWLRTEVLYHKEYS